MPDTTPTDGGRPLAVEYVNPDALQPHPDNPRNGNVDAIAESIDENGVYRPIVVQRSTGHILAGNHTFQAMLQHGDETIPVVYVDADDERATRIMLADNRTADLGGYNDQLLIDLMEGLPSLEGTGYTEDDLDDLRLLQEQGAADLDALADDLGEDEPTDGLEAVALRVEPSTADHWASHRKGHESDDTALAALLDLVAP